MTLGSLFDGIGGWQLAAVHAGVKPVWSSEIERFPIAVTAKHFPNTLQLGDITKINPDELEPVDIVCAGSPCQDLSVAGKREGLKGERSGLFMYAIKLVRELRRRTGKPRYFVWENVPGAFSSNKGLDFRAVLEEISQTEIPMPKDNKWANAGVVEWGEGSLAWRVLDAQYWGVPQRRKRIFLVADFGGQSAGEILFECDGVPRHPSAGREAREGTSSGTESGVRAAVVRMRAGKPGGGKGALVSRDKSLALAANANDQVLFVPGKARTLTARADGSPCIDRGPQIIAAGFKASGTAVHPINLQVATRHIALGKGTVDRHAVAHLGSGKEIAGCLMANCATKHWLGNQEAFSGDYHVISRNTVRRLTPTEFERLQGLQDNYTLIDDKSCSDTARYKALGNGMAQPCADWVIQRIEKMALGVGK